MSASASITRGGNAATGCVRQPQRARDLAEDQAGVLDGSQVDEDDAVGEPRRRLGGHGEGEAGLADAGRAGEGEQPRVGLGERRHERREFGVPTDQGERRTRERGTATPGGDDWRHSTPIR